MLTWILGHHTYPIFQQIVSPCRMQTGWQLIAPEHCRKHNWFWIHLYQKLWERQDTSIHLCFNLLSVRFMVANWEYWQWCIMCWSVPHSMGEMNTVVFTIVREAGKTFNPTFSYNRASLVAQTVKASVCNAGDPASIPGSGRSLGEGNGSPLQHSCLENPMDRGAW